MRISREHFGQNWGAELFGRVSRARNYGYFSAVVWGVALIGLLHLAAEPVARVFSDDADVVKEIVGYLWIDPIGYATVAILNVTEETLNAIGKPIIAAVQTLAIPHALICPFQIEVHHGKINDDPNRDQQPQLAPQRHAPHPLGAHGQMQHAVGQRNQQQIISIGAQ